MDNLFEQVKLPKVNTFSPNVLAYIGDSVYELFIRHIVLSGGNKQMFKIHEEAKRYSSGKGQVTLYEKIKGDFTQTEEIMFKKGRNSKPGSYSKNLELAEYKIATGLECVFGYLYVTGDTKRITELILKGIKDEQ